MDDEYQPLGKKFDNLYRVKVLLCLSVCLPVCGNSMEAFGICDLWLFSVMIPDKFDAA